MENAITTKKKKGFFQFMAELFFTIYLITLYVFVDKEETLVISKIAFIIFAGLTVVVILQRHRIHIGKDVMAVYFAFTWMFASIFWAANEYAAWTTIKTMWQIFILFFLVYNLFCEREGAHEYFLKSLYISGIVLIGYSIYVYGLSEAFEMMSGNRNFRLGREINQENTFGMLNATTCMVAFYYLFYKKGFKLFHIIVISLAFVFAMASGSRKALLMVCAGVLFLVYKKYGIRQIYKIIAVVVVILVILASIMQLPMFETINYRMELLLKTLEGRGRSGSSANVRMNMITEGWRLYKDRILTGFGANNYRIVSGFRTYAHNNFIEILVDYGLIGFILYYTIYVNVLKNLWNAKSSAGKGLIAIFLVRFFMEVALVSYNSKIHWVLFAFFIIKPQKLIGEKGNEKNIEEAQKSYS